MKMIEIKERNSKLIQDLVNIWESSVKTTHLFLSDDEIYAIKQYVPQALKEQWISELLLKFNIPNGMGKNNNSVTVKTLQELREKDLFTVWDFVIPMKTEVKESANSYCNTALKAIL